MAKQRLPDQLVTFISVCSITSAEALPTITYGIVKPPGDVMD